MHVLQGEAGEGDALSAQAIEDLQRECRIYCDSMDPLATLNIGALTLTKIKDTFAVLKNLVLESRQQQPTNHQGGGGGGGGGDGPGDEKLMKQVKELKSVLQQRDNEIEILVNMVKKGKTAQDVDEASSGRGRYDNDQYGDNRGSKQSDSRNHEQNERTPHETDATRAESRP